MSRINRRNWTAKDIGYKHTGEGFDLLDNMQKVFLRINDEEFDHLLTSFSDEEGALLVKSLEYGTEFTFAEKRQIIHILNKYINYEEVL